MEVNHIAGIRSEMVETPRLQMHLLTAGEPENVPLLFLHGNTSSSTIWERFMMMFADDFFCIAPDLRGFGLTDDSKLIDASRGMNDWVDDIAALIDFMNLPALHLVGHSLGGFVCWGIIAQHADRLLTATLIAPGPPMGFGGVHAEKGIPNNPDYSGSGAGIVVDTFAERIQAGDRSGDDPLYSPRNAMNRLFWKEGFEAPREEDILTAMLQIHTGAKKYPGDFTESEYWPGVAPGNYGPVNAISPKYNSQVLDQLMQVNGKPPLLWIQGEDDNIISDESFSDPGYQGKLDLRKGWPGDEQYPPQPMLSQIQFALEHYSRSRGSVHQLRLRDCGHTPFIEKPKRSYDGLYQHFNREK
jgi:pimeloyl-ACP methyl ester carboxylesterase